MSQSPPYQPLIQTNTDSRSNFDTFSNHQQNDFNPNNAVNLESSSQAVCVDTTDFIVKGSGGKIRQILLYLTLLSHIGTTLFLIFSLSILIITDRMWKPITVMSMYLVFLLGVIIYLSKIILTKNIIVPMQSLTAEQLHTDVDIPSTGTVILRTRGPSDRYYIIGFVINILFLHCALMVMGCDEVIVAVIINTGFLCLSYAFGVDPTVKINSLYAGIVQTPDAASGNENNTVNTQV